MYGGNDEYIKVVFALNTGAIRREDIDGDLLPLFENHIESVS